MPQPSLVPAPDGHGKGKTYTEVVRYTSRRRVGKGGTAPTLS
jgi:hypothetical protein